VALRQAATLSSKASSLAVQTNYALGALVGQGLDQQDALAINQTIADVAYASSQLAVAYSQNDSTQVVQLLAELGYDNFLLRLELNQAVNGQPVTPLPANVTSNSSA
jgi:hypothetical protein